MTYLTLFHSWPTTLDSVFRISYLFTENEKPKENCEIAVKLTVGLLAWPGQHGRRLSIKINEMQLLQMHCQPVAERVSRAPGGEEKRTILE